jgi:hypothetical protein
VSKARSLSILSNKISTTGSSTATLSGLTGVSSTGFTGALTGNANTATTLQSARTINGVNFDGSANITIKSTATNLLTIGTGLSGTSYDGSSAVTIALANTAVTAGSYGSSTSVPVITVDAQGRITSASTSAISGSLTFTGDVTGTGSTGGSTALTLATVNANVGAFGSSTQIPTITVNAKGLVTAVSTTAVSIPSGSISVTGGDLTLSGTTGTAITNATLAASGVTAGTYTKITVDAKGRATSGTTLSSADLPTYTGTITSSQITTGLGFTPYNSTNPSGYITSSASISGNAATATTATNQSGGTVNATTGSFSGLVSCSIGGTYARYQGTDQYHGIVLRGTVSGTTTQTITPGDTAEWIEYGAVWNFREISTQNKIWATINSSGVTWNGNTVLHAANYNSYSPTLTGTGASGTWGINVTGSAGSVSNFKSFGIIYINPNGANANCTTAQMVSHLSSLGFFNQSHAVGKCAWDYAGNNDLTDTGFGTIDLAGCMIETATTTGGEKHIRITRPTTGAGGFQVLVYVDHGSGYSPGWRAMMTSENIGSFALATSGGSTVTSTTYFRSSTNSSTSYGDAAIQLLSLIHI